MVADEVRSLASRTQTADDAVRDTQSAGEALRRSLDAVANITALNQENAANAQQQHHVTDDMYTKITAIEQRSRDNLENAKTVLSASQQLQQALVNMQQQLRQFKY